MWNGSIQSLAMEGVGGGVRVNIISPVDTLTPTTAARDCGSAQNLRAETPMARIASVDEMVGPATFLLARQHLYHRCRSAGRRRLRRLEVIRDAVVASLEAAWKRGLAILNFSPTLNYCLGY